MKTANQWIRETGKVYIRFDHSQIGMFIESSLDGKTWSVVELQRYGQTLDTARQEKTYLDLLQSRGIVAVVVQS